MDLTLITDGFSLLLGYLWIIPIGVFVGMLVGSTPGLSASNSTAILLPLILGMSPEMGLIFIVSIYAGAEMGNSFPAILLNIPGTAGAAVTTIEGYPMAQNGDAAKAMGICVMASVIGGILGGAASLLFAPLVADFALKFSSVELFIVILFGVIVIAQLSSGGLQKGLMAGFFGLLLATTGTDPMFGQFRGTFDSVFLIDGMPVIPVLVGALAFSELLNISTQKPGSTSSNGNSKIGLPGIFSGFKEVLKRPAEWIRSSFIGVVVGAIPGAGASIASFISYQQSYNFASKKRKKLFGKGSPEGLIAADVSNNAVVGGSLIPLLTLGIPGSSTMAVAFIVMGYHGLEVGPRLFENHGATAYALLWSQFFSAALILVIGLLLSYGAYRIAFIPVHTILPVVTIFALVGGFAYRQYLFDIWLVLIFGLLGYVMKRHGYPPIAMLLGVILGTGFEAYFFRALRMGHGSPSIFFERPLALTLWALLALTIIVPWLIQKYRSKREA